MNIGSANQTNPPAQTATAEPELSITEAQADLIARFQVLEDWMERYQYIIDLGRKLPSFPDEWCIEDNRLHGCQSQVWLRAEKRGNRLHFDATSDAAIVLGLIAILLRIYGDRRPEEILSTRPDFIKEIGLDSHLSATRSNGLHSMLKALFGYAQNAVLETSG
ncbi:MAG: SufE family protein [Gammaproteobacteria bacterium]|nr:SufE family protein [Gammaproteobacteria bacterium]